MRIEQNTNPDFYSSKYNKTVVIMQNRYQSLGEIGFYCYPGNCFTRSYCDEHTVAIFIVKPKLAVTSEGNLNYAA